MDYSVGSLSDLITGSNTPNKRKVVKKEIVKHEEAPNLEQPETDNSETPSKRKVKKNKTVKGPVEKATKKRKLQEANETPSPKKPKHNGKNAERRIGLKSKGIEDKPPEDPELLARTVFVGNLPITSDTKKLKRFFTKFGKVEAVRIRGVPVANPKMSKKVAAIKKEFHPERKSIFGFIRFEEREGAVKATEANGKLYQDHHLRVHLCDITDKPDETKAIFVGNLSFYAEEEDLWNLFESCGPISSVRIVRDGKTGIGKGFGYVNFQNSDSVTLALEMENLKLKDRELRISICNSNAAKKNKKANKVKKISKPGKPKKIIKPEKSEENPENQDQETGKQRRFIKREKIEQEAENQEPGKFVKLEKSEEEAENQDQKPQNIGGNKSFQGIKFVDKKKKHKLNKGLLQKKKLIKKVAPRVLSN